MLEHSIPIDRPLDLRSTLSPLLGSFRPDGWWFATRTAAGPASLRVTRTKERLHGTAWGDGGADLLGRLGIVCGLEDDGALATEHPLVAGLHRRNPGLRFGATGDVFAHLVEAIVGQKVTRTEADRAYAGLKRRFSELAPGPAGLRLPPDPVRMAAAPYWEFHELHLEKKRADTLRLVSARASRISELSKETAAGARTALVAIPGIGEWTAAKTIAPSLGDPDQVPVGDYHLKNLVAFHLAGRPRGSDEEMVELLEEFRPQRGRVIRLLHGLGHAPKFGARLAPRDITRI